MKWEFKYLKKLLEKNNAYCDDSSSPLVYVEYSDVFIRRSSIGPEIFVVKKLSETADQLHNPYGPAFFKKNGIVEYYIDDFELSYEKWVNNPLVKQIKTLECLEEVLDE